MIDIKRFYTGKSYLLKLLDEFLDDETTIKIEINPIRFDEFSTTLTKEIILCGEQRQ